MEATHRFPLFKNLDRKTHALASLSASVSQAGKD